MSTLHATTLAGMLVFEQSFPQQLKTLSGLPAPVAKTLDQHLPESQVLDSLVAAGKSSQDRSELSWTALGRWAQDTRFLQYCSRLWFMSCQWAVPVDDVLPVAKAAAAGHPYAKFVDSLGLDRQRQRAEIIRLLADFPLADLDYRADPLFQTLYQVVDAARSREITQRVHDNFDDCYEDFAILLNWIHGPKLPWAKTLLRISPYSPAARAILIAEDWEAVRDKAEQWEKESQRPEVLLALGRRYSELKKLDDAERCFQRALALSPEIDTYRLLAGLYKDRGQTEQWLGTLEKVLQEADTGLDHASVRVEIARHFMAQKDFRRAQPYAEAAAESWARWAMQCASECEEGLGNWAQAELWARRISERYAPDATYVWFFWCQRTGKGDLQAAQRFYAEELQRPGAPQSNDYRLGRSVLWALTGEPRKAAEAAEPVVAAGANALFSVFLALFLDEAGERQRRDQALKAVDPKNPYKPLADFFLACLAKGETAAANVAEAEMILKKLPPRERLDSYCLLGRFLELHGQAKAAREYYQRQLAEEPFSTSFTAILSGSRLHREGK